MHHCHNDINISWWVHILTRFGGITTLKRKSWRIYNAPSTLRGEIWKWRSDRENASKCFPSRKTRPGLIWKHSNQWQQQRLCATLDCKCDFIVFENLRSENGLRRSPLKCKVGVFKPLRLEERFQKAVNGRPNCRNKLAYLNFSRI